MDGIGIRIILCLLSQLCLSNNIHELFTTCLSESSARDIDAREKNSDTSDACPSDQDEHF